MEVFKEQEHLKKKKTKCRNVWYKQYTIPK